MSTFILLRNQHRQLPAEFIQRTQLARRIARTTAQAFKSNDTCVLPQHCHGIGDLANDAKRSTITTTGRPRLSAHTFRLFVLIALWPSQRSTEIGNHRLIYPTTQKSPTSKILPADAEKTTTSGKGRSKLDTKFLPLYAEPTRVKKSAHQC